MDHIRQIVEAAFAEKLAGHPDVLALELPVYPGRGDDEIVPPYGVAFVETAAETAPRANVYRIELKVCLISALDDSTTPEHDARAAALKKALDAIPDSFPHAPGQVLGWTLVDCRTALAERENGEQIFADVWVLVLGAAMSAENTGWRYLRYNEAAALFSAVGHYHLDENILEAASLGALTNDQLLDIGKRTLLLTPDGKRREYRGTGDKRQDANWITLNDIGGEAALEGRVAALEITMPQKAANSALTAEATTRAAADTAESTARASADAALDARLDPIEAGWQNADSLASGTLALARLPELPGNRSVVTFAYIADLSVENQALIALGTIVCTGEGKRWRYIGGDKTQESSYMLVADISPDLSDVVGLVAQLGAIDDELDTKASLSYVGSEVADLESAIGGLTSALDGKAPMSHGHSMGQITGLGSALAGKAAFSHNHPAHEITSGVFDLARIPVLPSMKQIVSSGGFGDLTVEQLDEIGQGTVVTLANGERYVYSGTGDKTEVASYVKLADISPLWSDIEEKPSTFPSTWPEVAGKPSSFPSTIPEVTGLEAALEGKAAEDHDQELVTILWPNAPTVAQPADLLLAHAPVAMPGVAVERLVPAEVFLRPADLLIARLRSLGAVLTVYQVYAIERFYNYALSVGLLKGQKQYPGANMLVTVWNGAAKQANLVDWLDPWGGLGSYVTNAGAAADGSTMNMPGGEIGQLSANGHVVLPPTGSATPRLMFGGALTEISSGTPTNGLGYVITDNAGSADFAASGAANNDVGTVFTANGVAPTWGAGKLQRAYLPNWCVAHYSRTAPGAANENFGGGRVDSGLANGNRYFVTTFGGNHLLSPGWTGGSFSIASNGGKRGLMLLALDTGVGAFTWRRHTSAGGLTLTSGASGYTDTYGMYNKTTPLAYGGYWRGGATETLHSEPWSLQFWGWCPYPDNTHSGPHRLAEELHDLAGLMAVGVNSSFSLA